MNLFVIPSWYPSASNPIYGIFNKEQAILLAREKKHFNIGISTWGQGDDPFLLPISKVSSIPKLFAKHSESVHAIGDNLVEYFSPAYTWTRKVRKGNIKGIIKANELNMARYMAQFGKPDLISAQASYPAGIVARHLSSIYKIPYTITIHMGPFPFPEFLNRGGQLKSLIRKPLDSADKILVASSELKQRLQSFDLKKLTLIPHPVDTDFFTLGSQQKSSMPVILAIGRLEEVKGFDVLLQAAALIQSDFELRIGGEGTLRKKLMAQCDQLGLEPKVKWLGYLNRDQVRDEIQSCSFFVLPSKYETFGLVQLEAMACGKPIVATNCGGPADLISDEVGYLCQVGSPRGLAAGMEKMLASFWKFNAPEIRGEVMKKYSPKIWADNLETVFRGLQ